MNTVSADHASSQLLQPDRSGTSTPDGLSNSAKSSIDNTQVKTETNVAPSIGTDGPRQAILESFFPRVFVFASPDTEELVRLKGVYGGLTGLLRPFGERMQGTVVTRDSAGLNKSLPYFGVHFLPFHRNPPVSSWAESTYSETTVDGWQNGDSASSTQFSSSQLQRCQSIIDKVVNANLPEPKDDAYETKTVPSAPEDGSALESNTYYTLYLRKLLAGRTLIPHEAYTHPVACVIAISSQSSAPIETLRELYNETRQGNKELPVWLNNEFLRYYVLVHDEDHDEVARSTALFDQMKRHFGLHCHMLRIRSTECGPSNEEAMQLPACDWSSASEELSDIRRKEQDSGVDEFKQFLFESDVTSINTFIREMITQSIVPFMEGRITAWNDQVASRRRGISGRFMSLSKKWAGFGTNRNSKTSMGPSGMNYNAPLGAYLPDSPEAVMHRLADYAFMLGDWRLSSSTYDILRADFGDDKAWKHTAVANEMAAFGLLLQSQGPSSNAKSETIDQMLDTASYSYLSRTGDPMGVLRCLFLAIELYRINGITGVREASKWSDRLLELSILSPLAQSLLAERLAVLFQLYPGLGDLHWGFQSRKALFWNFLAADSWLRQSQFSIANSRLERSRSQHTNSKISGAVPSFLVMSERWSNVQSQIRKHLALHATESNINTTEDELDEVQEELHDHSEAKKASKRLSVGLQPPQADVISLFQRLNDPLDQGDDGFS